MILSELGDGWGPAFAADNEELEFIKEKEKAVSESTSFWIKGVGHLSLESLGYSEGGVEKLKDLILITF